MLSQQFKNYPRQFWLLMFGLFIDRTGGAMLFTFFALYVTKHFDVGITEAGIVFLIFSLTGLISGTIGGALTDKFGRKGVVIFGLVVSATSSLIMAFINDLMVFYAVAGFVGLFASVGDPAVGAMVSDMLPPEKRADGFAIQRIIMNISVTVGPMIGALLAVYTFLFLFIADAVTSIITALILVYFLAETRPQKDPADETPEESFGQTLRGYRKVFKDAPFIAFGVMSIFMGLVYIQMYSTLSVFLRDYRDFPAEGFGLIMSMNAAMVVGTQFFITKYTKRYPALLMLALGSVFYAVGFGMYGFVTAPVMFFVAMAIITVGEMVAIPTAQALVAHFSPEDMRGRYMAIFGLSWAIPHMIGPLMAGYLIDNYNPNLWWYLSIGIALFAAVGFVWLYQRPDARTVTVQQLVPAEAGTD